MTKQIEIIKKTRVSLLELVKDLSTEQLNKIPDGFNNNIIWNLAHMIAAQQGVCYVRAGLAPVVGEKLVMIGATVKLVEVVNLEPLTTTLNGPVVAPSGTTACI